MEVVEIKKQDELIGQEETCQPEKDIHADIEEEFCEREFEYQKRIAELEEEVEKLRQYKELLAKGLKEQQAALVIVMLKAIKNCVMFPSVMVNSLMADIPAEVREVVMEQIIEEMS